MVQEEVVGKREWPTGRGQSRALLAAMEPGNQLSSQGTSCAPRGPSPCLHKSDRSREGHGLQRIIEWLWLLCLFNRTAPLHRETKKVSDLGLADLYQKHLGTARKLAPAESAAFQH